MIKKEKRSKRINIEQIFSEQAKNRITFLSIAPLFQSPQISHIEIKNLRALGCVDQKFILASSATTHNLYLLDQHAVQQRIRYQYFIAQYKSLFSSQYSRILDITQQMKEIIVTKKSSLNYHSQNARIKVHKLIKNNWGFYFEQSKGNYYLSQMPVVFNRSIPSYSLGKILLDLQQQEFPKELDNMIRQSSCKGAIKFGDKIQLETADKMLLILSKCQYPFLCIHGRNLIHWIQKTPKKSINQPFKYESLIESTQNQGL